MRKLLFILTLLGMMPMAKAQSEFTPEWTYNIELALPAATSNEPFQDIMQGLVAASTYGQYSFPFHLNVGAGIRYSYFTVNEFSIPEEIFGGIHSGGAFLKIGWDKFYNDQFSTDFSVKVGYTENFVITDANKKLGVNPVRLPSLMIEPTVGLILMANERNSYRLNVGYCIQNYGFQPTHIGLDSNIDYPEAKFENPTQYLTIGFGYSFYFGIKASD